MNLIYTSIIMVNQIVISFLVPFKLTFWEKTEPYAWVYYDLFLDVLFFADILIRFNTPIYSSGRFITDRKHIAKTYLKTWFVLDLLACLPLSYLRKSSETWPRGTNDLQNLLTLNFNSLPRFYPMMMLPKMFVRIRSIDNNMRNVFKRATVIPIQIQNILVVLYWLLFVMNFCAGLLRSAANFNLKGPENWVSGDGLYDKPVFTQYVGAMYWAVVTVTTVGYGDITQ